MDYSGEGASVYSEAKGEYTRQLCQYLSPALQKYFLDLLATAKEREADPKKHLVAFQTLLEGISEWNVDKVQRETQSLAMSTQCDYLEELLTAVFIAHTKVLSAIRLTNRQKKLQITIPKIEHFLHRTMTECARLLWTNAFLFAATGTPLERQKNMRQIEGLVVEGVQQGIRGMLPVKSILREYLGGNESEEEEEEEEEEKEEEKDDMLQEAEPIAEHAVEPSVVEPAVEPAVERPSTPRPLTPRPSTPLPDTPATEIPTINLSSIPAEPEQMFDGIFKAAESTIVPTPRAATPPPRPATPPPPPAQSDDVEMIDTDDIPVDEQFNFEEL